MPHYVSAQIRDPKAVNPQATALQSNRSRPSDKSQVPLSFEIEKSLRMSKSDMQVRPIYRRKRDSIEGQPDDRVRRSRLAAAGADLSWATFGLPRLGRSADLGVRDSRIPNLRTSPAQAGSSSGERASISGCGFSAAAG